MWSMLQVVRQASAGSGATEHDSAGSDSDACCAASGGVDTGSQSASVGPVGPMMDEGAVIRSRVNL